MVSAAFLPVDGDTAAFLVNHRKLLERTERPWELISRPETEVAHREKGRATPTIEVKAELFTIRLGYG